MTVAFTTARERLIHDLEARLRERLPKARAELAARFIRPHYSRLHFELLEDRDPLDLYGAALTHLALAQRRPANKTLARAYNPSFQEDGWECPHTVIKIVTDDMPFLVDSVQMALHGRGTTILRIMHPIYTLRRDSTGRLLEILDRKRTPRDQLAQALRESIMHLEIVRQTDPVRLREIESDLHRVLDDVRRAVQDWQPMREALAAVSPRSSAASRRWMRPTWRSRWPFCSGFRVFEHADLEPDSHSAKALAHILDSCPRDELFQITP